MTYVVLGFVGADLGVLLVTADLQQAEKVFQHSGASLETWSEGRFVERKLDSRLRRPRKY